MPASVQVQQGTFVPCWDQGGVEIRLITLCASNELSGQDSRASQSSHFGSKSQAPIYAVTGRKCSRKRAAATSHLLS